MNFLKPHRWTGHEASDHQLGIDILNRWMPAGVEMTAMHNRNPNTTNKPATRRYIEWYK
jgi:hypothetical protein